MVEDTPFGSYQVSDELAFVDFFFQPHYNKPWSFLNTVALQALPPV